jgi:hypothetical protein
MAPNRLRHIILDTHQDWKEGLGRDAISFRCPRSRESILNPLTYFQIYNLLRFYDQVRHLNPSKWPEHWQYQRALLDMIKVAEVSGPFRCALILYRLLPEPKVLRITAGPLSLYNFRPRKVAYLCSAPCGFDPDWLVPHDRCKLEELHFNLRPSSHTSLSANYFQANTSKHRFMGSRSLPVAVFVHFTPASFPEQLSQTETRIFVSSLANALIDG